MSFLRHILRRRQQSVGERGEEVAAAYLKQQGYSIRARNVRLRMGEIDIVALAPDGRTIVIVEVKSAAADATGFTPEMHVTRAKQRKLAALAVQYVRRHGLTDRPVRFDVIAVEQAQSKAPTVRHHTGAFGA